MTSQDMTLAPQDGFELFDIPMDFQDPEAATLPFNLDIALVPSPTTNILGFDLSTGISSLESLSTMLNGPSDGEDQLALQRRHYLVTKPFSQAHIAPFARSRIEYSIEELKFIPKMMVEQLGTPWAHSTLYKGAMPRTLEDAHAACALYITRNNTNADHVARYIATRVEEISASTLPLEPLELLARAHALVLYQIMLVFGVNICHHAHAEALIPRFDEAGKHLLIILRQQNDVAGSLPLYPSNTARSAWRTYVFRESVRRTVLFLFQFTTIYRSLQGQLTSCGPAISQGTRVTLSAHLWNAKNAFDFAIAWNSKEHFLVKNLDFSDVLRDAKPDNIDIFGKMMMVGLRDIEDIRSSFYTRGGEL